MSGRRVEALLWMLAAAALLAGVQRLRGAEPEVRAPAPALHATPPEPRRVAPERLAQAERTINAGNPFRLDRVPAPIGFSRPGGMGMAPGAGMMPGMMPAPPPYEPPPPPRPRLLVSGIVGPPWQALLEGVPGREGAVVVRAGDVLGELRVREITGTTVVVASPDTTWRLTVRNPWQ